MSDLRPDNQKAWDRLFDLLYSCDETVTDAEVEADLRQAGIDVTPALKRVQSLIEQKKAQMRFQQAPALRASLLDKVRGVVGPPMQDLRTGARDFITRVLNGPEQAAYFHKLETAATEEDLQSLVDDLTKLAALRQTDNKNGPATQ